MLADDHLPPNGERDRVLQVPAHCQNARQVAPDRHRQRCVAAGAAHDRLAAAQHAGNGVVAWPRNRPVVIDKDVGDARQTLVRLLVVRRDRLVAPVSAGCDHRVGELAHQQMVQRRIGQHHADVGCLYKPRAPAQAGAAEEQ